MNPFARALLQIAREEGHTLSLEAIRNAAFQKLQSGETKTLVSTSVRIPSGAPLNVSPRAQVVAPVAARICVFWGIACSGSFAPTSWRPAVRSDG